MNYGKRYEQFLQLLEWARQGKTFIFHHSDMVAIDRKTWEEIQRKLSPKLPVIYYDEFDDLDPKMLDEFGKRLDKTTSKPS